MERERERECVCERERQRMVERRDSIGHKMSRWRNTSGEINVGLIHEINKIPENVNDLGPTVSVCFI